MVGQAATAASPRGQAPLPVEERDQADNLILLCPDCHSEIDKPGVLDLVTVEWLTAQKREHEARIRQVTGLDPVRETAILRLVGDLRGSSVELDLKTAANAVITTDARFPRFTLSADGIGIEIDLRQIPREATPTEDYWRSCTSKIDDTIEHKLKEAVRRGDVKHVSVFAYARLPSLVYLGSKLNDTYEVEIYQRLRATQAWGWTDAEAATFTVTPSTAAGPEAVLILNVSGTVDPADLPDELRHLPQFVVAIEGTPGVDAIASRASLNAFEQTIRDLLASFERGGKLVRRLHVFAALPMSAAVGLGRAHDRHVHPALAIYDRTDGAYRYALEIA
jgi:hypothetical protein